MGDEKTWRMFIGGEWVDSSTARPNLTSILRRVSPSPPSRSERDDADKAVAAARKAYEEVWFDTPRRNAPR